MRIPEKRLCDLCKLDIVGPYVRMAYPLNAADRARVEQQLPKPPSTGLFGFTVQWSLDAWRFEFCLGCAEGFMPMLAELKTQAIAAWLAEQQRKAEAPMGSEDT